MLGVKDDDAEEAKRKEVEALFAKVCNRLDAMSNFHFTPKAAVTEIAIKPAVPAIQMEETIPMGVAEEQTTAPQDVLKATRSEHALKGEAELSKEDRNRNRNNKKRRHRDKMQKKRAALRAAGLEVPEPSKLPSKPGAGKGGAGAGAGDQSVKTGHYAKSATLFRALQEEALGTIAGWKKDAGGEKKKKAGGGGARFKL